MTTCTQLAHHIRSTPTGRVTHCEPCGLPLTDHGLCPFHHGPMCDVCSMPLQTVQEQRWGRHSGCVLKRDEPAPWDGEKDEDGLGWLEREKNRLGGWREVGREYGKYAVREERR